MLVAVVSMILHFSVFFQFRILLLPGLLLGYVTH